MDINDTLEDLDISWINDFTNLDNEYKNYYSEELSFIKIHFIYINTNNEIEKVKEDKVLLKHHGILQKDELLSIIKHNSISNQLKYSLLYILKFNINLDPAHLKTFIKSNKQNIGSQFMKSITHLDDIRLEKSITMFHDINELLIIFQPKTNHSTAKKTLKVKSNANKHTKKRT
jgi:hypothetical protein